MSNINAMMACAKLPQGVDGKSGSGLKRESAHKNRFKKRLKHVANMAARAALYAEMDGETGSLKAGDWHARLFALSAGTAT